MTTKNTFKRRLFSTAILASSLMLAACNNDTGSTTLPGGDHDHGDSSGRLIFANSGNHAHAYVYDLAEEKIVTDLHLNNAPSAIHSSPDYRYALVFQRPADENQHQVQFIDSGLILHGDHVDVVDPSMLSFTLYGVRPAHYRSNAGLGAIFFDGGSDANALRFAVFNDASLATGSNHGMLAKENNGDAHHGMAEVGDGYVLATYSTGGVVQGVNHYEMHGDHFHDEGQQTPGCVRLHGGSSNAHFSAFGCEDGVLLAEFHNGHFHNHKVEVTDDNDDPVRITQVAGHQGAEQFAAFATGNKTLYAVDPAAQTATFTNWDGGDDATRQLHAFDAHGEHFLILGTNGTLYVLEADDWSYKGKVAVLAGGAATTPATAWTISQSDNTLYVTDVANNAILSVDVESLTVSQHTIELDFTPVGLAWTGVADAHDHDDDHGHNH